MGDGFYPNAKQRLLENPTTEGAIANMGDGFYPNAVQRPLVNHSTPGALSSKDWIVLHITDGPTAEGAMATFEQSVAPNRVSAHFVIDRDGTVYQLVPVSDTAWHASACNHRSVGIEHAAVANKLMATDAQYDASAKLVAWLCCELHIPCGREHVKTHNEASPQDRHVLCCTGALDPDKVVQMANAAMPIREPVE